MHPDLSTHLHSDECNEAIRQLHKCHQDHPLMKFTGYCNEFDSLMNQCLKKEREDKRRANYEKSQLKKMRDARSQARAAAGDEKASE